MHSNDNPSRTFLSPLTDSGPKSSADEEEAEKHCPNQKGRRQKPGNSQENTHFVPQLNSPDSLPEDPLFANPLGPSPRRSKTLGSVAPVNSKRNPSPYYYSDLLKKREEADGNAEEQLPNDSNNNATESDRQKRTLVSAKYQEERFGTRIEEEELLFDDLAVYALPKKKNKKNNSTGHYQNLPGALTDPDIVRLRHSQKEGDPTVRVQTPTLKRSPSASSSSSAESESTTSDDSNCSECQKRRREWHAQALALVQQSCNVVSRVQPPLPGDLSVDDSSLPDQLNGLAMAPHRLLGPVMCACAAPASTVDDDMDEMFRPRSIFYVHKLGEQGCADCRVPVQESGSTAATAMGKEKSSDDIPRITRRIYETSFDTKICRSDDDLDNLDNSARVALTPHSLTSSSMGIIGGLGGRPPTATGGAQKKHHSRRSAERHSNAKTPDSMRTGGAISASILSQDLEQMHIHDNLVNNNNNTSYNKPNDNTTTTTTTVVVMADVVAVDNNNVYTPSTPPSTAPLPMKFPGTKSMADTRYSMMNSNRSAPNLPQAQPKQLKSLQTRELREHHQSRKMGAGGIVAGSSDGSFMDNAATAGGGGAGGVGSKERRPRSVVLESGRVLELKRSHREGQRQNFSSTESMATSSSGGSMESIRSSTSEGNRSTSSSESRNSSSLSSHSSDSHSSGNMPGQPQQHQNSLRAQLVLHSKLHILSPISDKSSQEPGSEMSSQKRSPEVPGANKALPLKDDDPLEGSSKIKRRLPQNKNLLLVAGGGTGGGREEIQGSDSGISLHSRDGSGRSAFQSLGLTKFNPTTERIENSLVPKGGIQDADAIVLPQDLKDLPFDMPKLRRRRVGHQPVSEVVAESGCV